MCISALIGNTHIQPVRIIKSFSKSMEAVDIKSYFLVNIISKSGKINGRKKEMCVCVWGGGPVRLDSKGLY